MIAGTLEIQLLANMARLQKDMDDAKASVGNAMKSIETAVGYAKTALVGFIGVASVDAFKGMIRGAVDLADNLNDLSKTTGLAVTQLAGLKLAAKQSGGDLEGIAASINKLSVAMGKESERFAKLGITAKDPLEAFKQLADVFSAIEDPQLRAALGAEALGKSWASAAPLLSEGSKNIADMVAKGTALSGITQEMADRADQFNDRLAELEAVSGRAKMKLADEMLPAMTEITTAITAAYEESGKLQAVWVAIGALGAFAFTDQFSTATVKIEKLREELAKLEEQKALADNAPMVGAIPRWLFGSSDVNGDIAKTRAAIADLQAQMDQPAKDAAQRRADAEAKKQATAEAAEASRKASEFLKLEADAEKARAAALKAANEELKKQAAMVADLSGLSASFQEDWARLTAMFKAGRLGLDDLTTLQAKLLAKQPAVKSAMEEQAKALADSAKLLDAAAKAASAYSDATAKDLATLEESNKKLEEHNQEIGLGTQALNDLRLGRLDDALAVQEQVLSMMSLQNSSEQEIATMEQRIKLLKQQRDLVAQGAYKEAQIEADKAVQAERKKGWEETDRLARDVFTTWATDGSNAAQKIGDTLKTSLLSATYEASVKPIAFQIYSSATSALGIPGVGGSSGGVLDAISKGKSAYDVFSAGATGIGNNISTLGNLFGSASTAAYGAGMGLSAAEAGSAAAAYTTAAGEIAASNAALAATYTETAAAITAGSTAAASGASALAAIPGWGWAIGGALLLGGLFGGGKNWETKYGGSFDNTGPGGTVNKISGPGTGGEFPDQYAQKLLMEKQNTINALFVKLGSSARIGYFSAGAESSSEGQAFANAGGKLASGVEFGQSSQSGGYLNRRGNFTPQEAAKALAEELTQATLQALQAATDLPQAIAKRLAGVNIDALTGDALTQFDAAITKVITDANAVQYAMQRLPFASLRDLSFDTASALIDVAGGFDKLTTSLDSYYENFYSAEEKRSQTLTNLATDLAAAGVQTTADALGEMSRAQYRALVDAAAQNVNTAEGQRAYSALINLSSAFASITPAAQDAATALAATRKALLDAAAGAASAALSGLTQSVEAQKTALADAYDLQVGRFNDQLSTVANSVGKLQTLASTLKSTLDGMRIAGSEGQQRAAAQAQIGAALAIARAGGPLPLDGQLDNALRTVAQPSEQLYATFVDYARDFYRTANDIAALGDLTAEQLTADQITQGLLQDQLDLAKRGYDAQVKGLDETLSLARQQLDAANGTYTAMLSLTDAIKATTSATQALLQARAGQGLATGTVVGGALQTVAPDAGRLANIRAYINTLDFSESGAAASVQTLYAKAKEFNVTQLDLSAASGYALADVQALFARHGIPAFAGGGDHAGGLRVVGERGIELEATGPARIWNADQTRNMLSGAGNTARLEALVESLTAEVAALRADNSAENRAIVTNTLEFNKRTRTWDATGMPEVRAV